MKCFKGCKYFGYGYGFDPMCVRAHRDIAGFISTPKWCPLNNKKYSKGEKNELAMRREMRVAERCACGNR